jgi:putative hemolysin
LENIYVDFSFFIFCSEKTSLWEHLFESIRLNHIISNSSKSQIERSIQKKKSEEVAMFQKSLFEVSVLIMLLLLAAACQPKADMPNPASVFCEENEGKLEIREDEAGG